MYCKECLNWKKIKEYVLKQNKFNKATKEIEKFMEKDNIKLYENKEKKLNKKTIEKKMKKKIQL